jgi:hypothetical protein
MGHPRHLPSEVKIKVNVKSIGQECPIHTGKVNSRFLHFASSSFGRRSFGRNDRVL